MNYLAHCVEQDTNELSAHIESVQNKIDGMKSVITDVEELRIISIIEEWLYEAMEMEGSK